MDKLEDVRKKHRKLLDEARKLAKQIYDAELATFLPALQSKYVGKWFKQIDKDTYVNTTTYSKVLDVTDRNHCNTFRITIAHNKKGKQIVFVSIQDKEYDYLSLLGKPSSFEQAKFDYEQAQEMILGTYFKQG